MKKIKAVIEKLRKPITESISYNDFKLAIRLKEPKTVLGNGEIVIDKSTSSSVLFFTADKKYHIAITLDLTQFSLIKSNLNVMDSYWTVDDLSMKDIIDNLINACPSSFPKDSIAILNKWANDNT